MSNPVQGFVANIGLELYKLESLSTKKLLDYKTNPIIIYLCKVLVFDILKPIDYLILNPIIISSCFIIFCIDNIEIWSRFALRMIQYYGIFLRSLINYISSFHRICSTKIDDWKADIECQILLTNMEKCNCNNLYLKIADFVLTMIHFFNAIQLYIRIPILIAMNKTNAFTIKIQQSEIYLLRTKSHYLNEKNKWLSHYVSTMQKRRINEYNAMLLRKLRKYLKSSLPMELIHILYTFSHILVSNDKIKMIKSKKRMALKAVSKMNHNWIWKRYEIVKNRRNINTFEYCCWKLIYAYFKSKYYLLNILRKAITRFTKTCRISKHTLKMIMIQTTAILAFIYLFII